MIRYKTLRMWRLGKCAIWCIAIGILLQQVCGEISSNSNKENLEATKSSESTSSILPIASETRQTPLAESKKEKTLRFVNWIFKIRKGSSNDIRHQKSLPKVTGIVRKCAWVLRWTMMKEFTISSYLSDQKCLLKKYFNVRHYVNIPKMS